LIRQMDEAVRFLRQHSRWPALLLLLLFFGRLLHTAAVQSVTFDEVLHIFYGALYWRHDSIYSVVQNPPLINAIIGIPLRLIFQPNLPLEHPVWLTHNWLEISKTFMWDINDNGLQLIFVGRLAIIWLSLLLGALLFRWSGQLFRGPLPGLFALLLYTFDPNMIAHSFLASTDLGATFFLFVAAYLIWRYWRRPASAPVNRLLYLLAGMAAGLALAAKFSGIVLLPAILLMAGYRWLSAKEEGVTLGRTAVEVAGWLLVGTFVFLLVYRFDFATLQLDYFWQRQHHLNGHSAFFFGELSREGWWYYFPVVFALKTPLTTILLIVVALAMILVRRQFDWPIWWPLLIVGGVAGASLMSRVNIGYRYLLPALPLLFLAVSQLARSDYLVHRFWRRVTLAALLLTLVSSVLIHPHYLAYFNILAGGPNNAWRLVADSNIDWGQDIQSLSPYMQEAGIESLYISWLGTASLPAYGVNGVPIPAWPVVRENPLFDFFYPWYPAPGIYALSVTQLHGVYLQDPTRFHWFLAAEPDDKVGYSLFIYRVRADGPAAHVALSGIGLSHITLADYQRAFATNDVRPRWFDARSSLLWPGGGEGMWTAVGDGHLPQHPALQALYPAEGPLLSGENSEGWRYHLYQWPESPVPARQESFSTAVEPAEPAALFNEAWHFLGYETVSAPPYRPGEALELLSYWRVMRETAEELSIFVHLLDAGGQLVAQHDGLDVLAPHLRPGDEWVQLHTIHLPPALPAGLYTLQLGLYNRNSLARWSVETPAGTTDRVLLPPVQVGD
jgi:hypothetical protein